MQLRAEPSRPSTMSDYSDIVQAARASFYTGKTKELHFRKKQLKALLRLYTENVQAMCDALATDLRKSKQEAMVTEVHYLINDLKNTLQHFEEWSKPEEPPRGIVNLLDKIRIYKDPFGVVLVLGAWNYPLQLTLLPMGAAIAAGNCVVIKPSELAPASAKLMETLVPKYLDNECFFVVNGGVEETTRLLENKFDYIFFTGSTSVGKIVHKAANKYLTPVTLELGGKSPVYLDASANMEIAVKRIVWGKFLNAGQTCIAPDYVLCTPEVQEKFIAHSKKILADFFGADIKTSPDLPRIISDRHFKRLSQFLENNPKIAVGGNMDSSDRFIEPTILSNVSPDDPIMQDEIFGPILPIVPIANAYEAIQFINAREKPLALYIFSGNDKDVKLILDNTTSGGVCVNDTIMHLAVETLPFGGVGSSGMGAYHGKYSFDTFVHKKGVLIKNLGGLGEMLQASRYPPYNDRKLSFISMMLKKRKSFLPSFTCISYMTWFAVGALTMFAVQYALKKNSDDGNQ